MRGALRMEMITTDPILSEVAAVAKASAARYMAHGYNTQRSYWWGGMTGAATRS